MSSVITSQIPPYQAPQPKVFADAPRQNVLSRIFNRAISFLLTPVSKILTVAILPSSIPNMMPRWLANRFFERQLALNRGWAQQENGGIPVQVTTHDNAKLDAMLFRGRQKKAILYAGGNGEFYESSYHARLSLKREVGDINLFVFNPRGVGMSQGAPNAQKLAIDVYSAFRYLVDVEKMDPNDIVVFGHSLGGGYGAEGAALIQQEYPDKEINFVSHNSFKDLSTEVGVIVPKFLFPLVRRLLSIAHWQMNGIDALQKLKGKKLVIVHKADNVIPYRASLYKGLKDLKQPLNVARLKMSKGGMGTHCRPFNERERYEVVNQLKQMLRLPFSPSLDLNQNRLSRVRRNHG